MAEPIKKKEFLLEISKSTGLPLGVVSKVYSGIAERLLAQIESDSQEVIFGGRLAFRSVTIPAVEAQDGKPARAERKFLRVVKRKLKKNNQS